MCSVLAVNLKERDDVEDLGPEWRVLLQFKKIHDRGIDWFIGSG